MSTPQNVYVFISPAKKSEQKGRQLQEIHFFFFLVLRLLFVCFPAKKTLDVPQHHFTSALKTNEPQKRTEKREIETICRGKDVKGGENDRAKIYLRFRKHYIFISSVRKISYEDFKFTLQKPIHLHWFWNEMNSSKMYEWPLQLLSFIYTLIDSMEHEFKGILNVEKPWVVLSFTIKTRYVWTSKGSSACP